MLFHVHCRVGRAARSLASSVARRRYYGSLLDELSDRGFLQQVTRPQDLKHALASSPQVVYSGIDPTASSLHIGHLVPLICLLHFQLNGHTVIPLIGGATGLVGDPSGRKTEREPANVQQVEKNVELLSESIRQFLSRGLEYARSRLPSIPDSIKEPEVKSNLEWHKDVTLLDFLRTIGVHARVNTMLSKESVRTRLESSTGISFTEFTYQLLQAYDFYHLHHRFGCTIQIGGSDQWGNIVAGLEFINRLNPSKTPADEKAFGVTTPLLTTASGEKFGKSAGNAIWLNPELTSIFDFYQYFLKVEDADVEKYLKLFTLLPLSTIQTLISAQEQEPEKRMAQRRLAAEVTELVHGAHGVAQAERITKTVFRQPDAQSRILDAQSLLEAFKNDSRLTWCDKEELTTTPVAKLASRYGLVSSTSSARQLVQSRGLYYNDNVVPDAWFVLQESDLLDGRLALIRAGKDKVILLAIRH